MTAADHANTVRRFLPDEATKARAALDALAAQAETAEAARQSLDERTRYAAHMLAERDTAVQAAEQARAALQQLDEFCHKTGLLLPTDIAESVRAALAGNQP